MTKIEKILVENKDDEYALFSKRIIPDTKYKIIGVRTPVLKSLAKQIGYDEKYINSLPHKSHEENQLHSFMLYGIKDYSLAIKKINEFLPYVDNWATCDQLDNKTFVKNKDKLIIEIKRWIKSKKTYICRFGVEMLMRYYLDDDFKPEYLNYVKNIKSKEYYVNMIRAWYYATALAKQYKDTIKIIESKSLDVWTHNKTIQKAIESYRIDDKTKNKLRKLKINCPKDQI